MQKLLRALGVAPEQSGLTYSIYFAFFANGLMSIILGTLLPYILEENALNYSESGLLLSSHQVGNLGAVLLAGFLPRLVGQKKSALALGLGSALGMILMALIPGIWPLLLLAFAFTGIGRGAMSNLCNAVVSRIATNRGAALNLLHGLFALGALLSPFVVFLATMPGDFGWKRAALAVGALTAAAWFFLLRARFSGEAIKQESGASLAFLRDRQIWLGTMILFFDLSAEASIVGWFVVYFRETGILPELAARFVPTMLWMMMLIGRVICAVLGSRVNKLGLMLVLSAGVTFCFAGLLLSGSAALCTLFLLGLGLSMGGIYPTVLATVRGTDSAAATGFIIATASLGSIIMPSIVGAVADSHGLTGGVATVLVALACMTALTVFRLVTERQAKSGASE